MRGFSRSSPTTSIWGACCEIVPLGLAPSAQLAATPDALRPFGPSRGERQESLGGPGVMSEQSLRFEPMSGIDAELVVHWRYEGELGAYDIPLAEADESVGYMTDPANGYFSVRRDDELIGFCSIGRDGQVPGGPYDDSAVDVGAGMRPDLVAKGDGAEFLREVMTFLRSASEKPLRASIASWNQRALAAAQGAGFKSKQTFTSTSGIEYTVLLLTP